MGFPKKIKKNIELTNYRTLYPRREELFEMINKDGTFLPKSVLHADLDRGFLDFVKEDLKVVTDGKIIPTVDIIVTTQNWTQFTQTWNFQDLDKNTSLPFITVVRQPEIKYGSNPSLLYTIPNRRQYYYASVPHFDGNHLGVDVYQIPQPIPVDIKYSVKILCNRMRELNTFNKAVLQKFSSRQAYRNIKGHYIPIVWDNIADESVTEVEKRKFYIQTYDFTMLGFLIDEDEFEVKPGIQRTLQLLEASNERPKKGKRFKKLPNSTDYPVDLEFASGSNQIIQRFYDKVNLNFLSLVNVNTYDVYINEQFYGSNITKLQLNSGDLLRIEITKVYPGQNSEIKFVAVLI
jgi:hypothetical protein